MKKLVLVIVIVCLITVLSSCQSNKERVVEEIEVTYDYIGVKSITVNDELFTTVCKANKDDGLWNTHNTLRIYTDSENNEYLSLLSNPCSVIYNNTLFHGFDLLEDKILNVDELFLLEYPFEQNE